VRLDHLLSKEQLARTTMLQNTGYRVQSHISGERPGVASSLVEHWLFGLVVSQRQLVRLLAGRNGDREGGLAEHAVGP
jgi:hypothetical protein